MLTHGSPQPAVLQSHHVPAAGQEMLRGWERKAWLECSNTESQVIRAKYHSGVSRTWRKCCWTNTSFQEMLENYQQRPVIQHLNGVKGTVRDKGHRSTRTQPSINPE